MTENYIKKYPITSPMAEDTKLILNKLGSIKEELDYIKDMLEDSILTGEESKLVNESLRKIKQGNKSDFISLKN